MDETVFNQKTPAGEYRDILLDDRGRCVWQRPWHHNLIVDGLRRLLAALVKGDPLGESLAYWAVGTGQETWDDGSQPSETARRTRSQLYHETCRKTVPSGQITFLGGSFTNRLEITMDFTTADIPPGTGNANWRLREFGLFAGGSVAADSGILINHRIHPRIDMQDGFTLQRTLRLTF